MVRETADDFSRHRKNRSLDLALAVRQKFKEYVNYKRMRGEISDKFRFGDINELIDSLILALEKNEFNEHWKIAGQLENKIKREKEYIPYEPK